MNQRIAQFEAVANGVFDILVIGGGIVGAGIARDAAMRGLRVCLVEQYDFASGTSGRSSRFLHGGIRYLAQGRLGLVREASLEKKIIHKIAPHLAEPLAFIFPTYRENKHWRLWKLKMGVKIYDLLCGGQNLGRSSWLGRADTVNKVPGLREEGLAGAVRYYDGFTNDARLVLDTLRSAAKHSATLFNYCRLADVVKDKIWNCDVHDVLSNEIRKVQAQVVVNATGPWADRLPHSRVKLRNTKGVHIVVERGRVPVPDTVVMTEEKRIMFAIPWGERTILGTTDTDFSGVPESVAVQPEDIRYILQVVNHFFPSAKLRTEDVISSWAGVRPLIDDARGNPSDISRAHQISNPEAGWWDVAGGKLTTYRLMAEQVIDRIIKATFPDKAGPCRTAKEPLLSPVECEGISGTLPPPLSRELVRHFCANEWAAHVDDVMVRRAGWHYYFEDATQKAELVAEWMGEYFGWRQNERGLELERYRAFWRTPPGLPFKKFQT